ncbi:MAG: helix-turn-helix domain-containing protein [Phycisphaerales bacterium]|nr:helix-turn-helix domain-containing protein [Phycisphaerales bacterium]
MNNAPTSSTTNTFAKVANPAALTVAQLAKALGIAEERVHRLVADGAPTAANGTIHLVHFAAWLNRRLKDREGGGGDGD